MPEIAIQASDGSRRRVPLDKERVSIGRSRESDIFLPDQWLSRHHAEICLEDDGTYYLRDLGSKNGTLLNGERIRDAERLRPGDVINLGEHVLTFSIEETDEPEEEVAFEGTRVFSVKELSDVITKPALDPQALAEQNRILAILIKANEELRFHKPQAELFETILDLLFQAIPAERGAILLQEGVPPLSVIKASRSRHGPPVVKVSRSITRRVLADRVSLFLPNLMEDATFRTQDSILSSGIRSALCAPLWLSSGASGGRDEVIGEVYLDTLARDQPFTEEDLKILTALANVAAAKIENVRLLEETLEKRRLEEDMRIAAEIQTNLLPKRAPDLPGYALAGSNRPCRTVGGDYYDFAVDRGQLLLALGDVSGKGTGAALLMTVLRAAVRGHWSEGSVADAVARINRTVCQNVPDNKYITFFVARLDPATGRLNYVNAGHNPPLLVRADGRVEELTEGGMVLGLLDSAPYVDATVALDAGDVLVVFSDGVTETWNPADEEFGEQRLAELAARHRALDAPQLQEVILQELEGFASGVKAGDDRTLIVLKRH
jgi:serine phosphatase RsbU (regulator of sigma subunit)/pSer/pThr/pTyr-binding forkhead associated (FHA) protein